MKHSINLCTGCIKDLDEYYPYIVSRNQLEITEVSIDMCDNMFDKEKIQKEV